MFELRSLHVTAVDTVMGVVIQVEAYSLGTEPGSARNLELRRAATLQLDPESSMGHWAMQVLEAAQESL